MGDPCLREPVSSTVLLTVGASGSQGYAWSYWILYSEYRVLLLQKAALLWPAVDPWPGVCVYLELGKDWMFSHQAGGGNVRYGASPDVSTGPLQPPGPPPSAPAEQWRLAAQVMLVRLGSRMTARLLSSLPARGSFALSTPSVWSFEFQAECPLKQMGFHDHTFSLRGFTGARDSPVRLL